MKKRITTIAVLAAAIAAPVAGSATGAAQAHSARSTAVSVRAEREVRIVGQITKLTASKLVVKNANGKQSFSVPSGFNTAGFRVGDRVEAEGVKRGGQLVLRSLKHEDGAAIDLRRGGADDGPNHDRGDDHGNPGGGHK